MSLYRKVLSFLTPRERRQGALMLVMVVIMAAFETAGVASILPFLAVLSSPEVIDKNSLLQYLYSVFGFTSVHQFLIALGIASFCLIVFAAGFRIVTVYVMNRYIQLRRHSIGERLLETYLQQPYTFYLDRHSSDLAKNILSEVDQLIGHVLKPTVDILAYGVVACALVLLLVLTDPVLALTVGLVIGGVYLLVFLAVKGALAKIGRDRVRLNRERFAAAVEALSGIKDIKLFGRERAYLSRFRAPSRRYAEHHATNLTLSSIPKYIIEVVAFGGLLLLVLYLLSRESDIGDVIPVLGLYAFAGYRLLPAAQYMYAGFANLKFGGGAITTVFEDLRLRHRAAERHPESDQTVVPREHIDVVDVSYTYPRCAEPTLQHINLRIPVGASVGLVGETGSGKTTLVDLILGLLLPSVGSIAVDGEVITPERLRGWQRSLGYVPQSIFLVDSTIAENIAFGVPKLDIDHQAVERAARLAQIHDFIVDKLPAGYETQVGERGVRLSGGQRQRIGIARALYLDPSVLVCDEATSALDAKTEQSVMKAIHSLKSVKTVLLIAHRVSTVRDCDTIVFIGDGRVKGVGTFAELVETSAAFCAIAGEGGSA